MLKAYCVLLAATIAAVTAPSRAAAQPVPVLPAPIERTIVPMATSPSGAAAARLDRGPDEEDGAVYPGYYGWRTYAPSYYGLGSSPTFYHADRPFYGFSYQSSGHTALYRPFYYRYGFYHGGPSFGSFSSPFGTRFYSGACGAYD